jgi:hypothetical protein
MNITNSTTGSSSSGGGGVSRSTEMALVIVAVIVGICVWRRVKKAALKKRTILDVTY